MHSNWPKKVFIWFAAGNAGVALYVPIYNIPNSLLAKSIFDCDTLVGKELGLARLK